MTFSEPNNYLEQKGINQASDKRINTISRSNAAAVFDALLTQEPDPVQQTESEENNLVHVQKIGIKLTCKRVTCGHSWVFSGSLKKYYTTCPRCHSSVPIKSIVRNGSRQ